MEQVDIIVVRDQLPNLLEFAGKNNIFHQIEFLDAKLPEGVKPVQAIDILAKSANLKTRSNTLTNTLQVGEQIQPEKLQAPTDNLEDLASFIDQELSKIEAPVRELENREAKLQESLRSLFQLPELHSGLSPALSCLLQ